MTKIRVTIVDYGLGNLFSLGRALTHIGADVRISSDSDELEQSDMLFLPGVGAFGDGMNELGSRGLVEPLLRFARSGRSLVGICLGMQLFFQESEEFGRHEGLGLLEGSVVRMQSESEDSVRVKLPHVGWSELHSPHPDGSWRSHLFQGLEPEDAMYFVHSYAVRPAPGAFCVAEARYGTESYCAAVQKENVIGFQFHPEKSGACGLRVLRNCFQAHHSGVK